MRRRLGFIRHILSAILWLVSIVCCLEVGWRVVSLCSEAPPVALNHIATIPCARIHHQLVPFDRWAIQSGEGEEPVEVQLNSLGLRGPEPVVPKPAGLLRIVCLGDETTFGPGLPDEELFTSRLQTYLSDSLSRPVEVINAGVPGYCPLLSMLQYRHQLQAFEPDVILLTFDMSDVADDHGYRSFMRLDDQGFPLACRNPALDATQRTREVEECFASLTWIKQELKAWKSDSTAQGLDDINHSAGRYAWIRENPPDWSAYLANALEPVNQLQQIARQPAPLILFSVCPAPWQVSEEATPDPAVRKKLGVPVGVKYGNREPFQKLANFAQNSRWNFLDASLAFEQAGNPEGLYLEHAPWLSARGHELYAGIVSNWMLYHFRNPGSAFPTQPAPLANRPDSGRN